MPEDKLFHNSLKSQNRFIIKNKPPDLIIITQSDQIMNAISQVASQRGCRVKGLYGGAGVKLSNAAV